MADGGNIVPALTKAEHIGPNTTGDNIEAKRVGNYVWNGSTNQWERMTAAAAGGSTPTGLMPFEFDDIQFSNADANGNYQTATVKNDTITVATLTFTFDANSKLTGVTRS